MTSYRVRNLGVAAGLALAAVILVVAYLSNYKHHVQSGEAHITVYVASKPIPAGTSAADLLNSHLIHKTTVLQRNLVPGFIDDPAKLSNLFVTRPLFTNEQVTLDSFGRANARGLQGQLAGTDRAIQVSGTPEQLLAGTLRDGRPRRRHGDAGGSARTQTSRSAGRSSATSSSSKAPEAGTKARSRRARAGATVGDRSQLKMSDTAAPPVLLDDAERRVDADAPLPGPGLERQGRLRRLRDAPRCRRYRRRSVQRPARTDRVLKPSCKRLEAPNEPLRRHAST